MTTEPTATSTPTPHPVVTADEWLKTRRKLLQEEKELTRHRDRVCAARRSLPWTKLEKSYEFQGPRGTVSLADLFEGRSQLMIQHFMFGPDWDEGCSGCSFLADHVDAARQHFEHADLSYAAVSRAPWATIAPFKKRMGWQFAWVSSHGSDFNYDFHVSFTDEELEAKSGFYNFEPTDPEIAELPGASVFYRDGDGTIFHTYSGFARGGEDMIGAFMFLDYVPKGRNEKTIMDWVRHHDRYDDTPAADPTESCCH
ncbi:thioredoxin family protein [soil metagenome]